VPFEEYFNLGLLCLLESYLFFVTAVLLAVHTCEYNFSGTVQALMYVHNSAPAIAAEFSKLSLQLLTHLLYSIATWPWLIYCRYFVSGLTPTSINAS
jgi:hypothetical protein